MFLLPYFVTEIPENIMLQPISVTRNVSILYLYMLQMDIISSSIYYKCICFITVCYHTLLSHISNGCGTCVNYKFYIHTFVLGFGIFIFVVVVVDIVADV